MTQNKINLRSILIDRLCAGPLHIPTLVQEISTIYSVTLQGVYKALRELKEEEVVTVHKKHASLSGSWLLREKDKIIFAENAYISGKSIEKIIRGEERRNVFKFRSLNEIDLFWTHAFQILAEQVSNQEYSYAIQPHDWYFYVRFDTDYYWMKKHQENGRPARTILSHSAGLDPLVIRERKKILGNSFSYTLNENPLNLTINTYYNVLGNYIFKAEFDPRVATLLHTFVCEHDKLPLDATAQNEIDTIVAERGKFTLTIERNEKRAGMMTKKVKKYFEF